MKKSKRPIEVKGQLRRAAQERNGAPSYVRKEKQQPNESEGEKEMFNPDKNHNWLA